MKLSEVVRDYLTKNPELLEVVNSKWKYGDRTIARILHKEMPDKFKTIEQARDRVREVRGKHGSRNRDNIKDPEKRKFFDIKEWGENWITTGEEVWRTPFQIPVFENLNIIADVHSAYASQKALDKFFKLAKDKEALLINGDLLDSKSLTRHIKVGKVIDYADEIDMMQEFLKILKSEFNHVYVKEGNHDFWLERFITQRAPELQRLRGTTFPELLKLTELGIHHIHNLQPIKYGDLDIVHGHEFPSFGGNVPNKPALSLLRKWMRYVKRQCKVLGSHVHVSDFQPEKAYDGKVSYGWTTPAMCLKGAEYAPFTGWDNGHTEVKNGNNGVEPKNIVYET